ncbi:hypothetical protein FGIG_12210 [Fasciola gigantica]|uniref:Uncharacterized protein n=1 Tax=Fasciola gigantica TaxID=46835 RepID=A0A504YHP5_FASGI|nr:hypothetical protein FGIG_12210 [Fasciola gigantica]
MDGLSKETKELEDQERDLNKEITASNEKLVWSKQSSEEADKEYTKWSAQVRHGRQDANKKLSISSAFFAKRKKNLQTQNVLLIRSSKKEATDERKDTRREFHRLVDVETRESREIRTDHLGGWTASVQEGSRKSRKPETVE